MKKLLLHEVRKVPLRVNNKVTVVGSDKVGAAIAFTLLLKGLANDIAIVCPNADRALGEVIDLQHASIFLRNAHINGGSDFSISAGSRICIIAPETSHKKKEHRNDLVKRNLERMKNVIPALVKHSPETIILVISRPVALWSGVNVAGVRLHDLDNKIGTREDAWKWDDLRVLCIKREKEFLKLKNDMPYGVSLSTSIIVQAILSNADIVLPVSTMAKGFHDIGCDVFLSLPCVMCKDGVSHVVNVKMSEEEKRILQCSAQDMRDEIDKLSI